MNGTNITIDVTDWPTPVRKELLDIIDELAAKAAAGNPPVAAATAEEVEPSGWNQDAYLDVLKKLLSKHHVQVAVIFEAIKNGTGYVSRERVYELGNYPAERSLKGFTRPVNRVTVEAVEAGLLPDDADDLLAPVYDPAVSSFQRASGFVVPMEVVRMAQAWRDEAASKA